MNDIPLQTLALIGSYVPRRCGIATFTKDLRDAVASEGSVRAIVLAMDDKLAGYSYPEEVRFQIQESRLHDYQVAAELLNINQIDLAVVQHEYGIFGGRAGDHVLALVRNLRMPVIVNLHTVLSDPTREQASVMRELVAASDRVTVMCRLAARILEEVYRVPNEKIAVIPHGIPDVPFVDSAFYKDRFGLQGRPTLMTFGLLSPGKGIEVAIKALPAVAERYPDVAYVVLGAMHPHLFARDGNTYLISLELLSDNFGVRQNVLFHSRYVTLEELCAYLGATDIYVTPYPNKDQVVSGTLAYAMGTGKAVVSTPYRYAEEMLANRRGRLFPFGESDTLADIIIELLDDPVERAAMRKRAYMYCRSMVWKKVVQEYLRLGQEVLNQRRRHPKPVFQFRTRSDDAVGLPEINVNHMRTMTDDTGILQHAIYAIPDRFHGYCTDDNSRALVASMLYLDVTGDESILLLARLYLSFLHYAFDSERKRFRNLMSYERQWLEEPGSEDCQGRSIWGLGLTTAVAPDDAILALASRLLCDALTRMEEIESPRAMAFALVGIHAYLERFSGDSFVRRAREQLARKLYGLFRRNAASNWPWCEDEVTYDNAKLPHALILSGQWLPDGGMLEQGLRSLEWLVNLQIDDHGKVSLIGNQGWLNRDGSRARFDQQPIEAMSLTEACTEAYRCTGDAKWSRRAHLCLRWFLRNNDTESMLYDSATGGCRDGLHPSGPNMNEGAESTLAWLITLLTIHQLQRESTTGVRHLPAELPPKDEKPKDDESGS